MDMIDENPCLEVLKAAGEGAGKAGVDKLAEAFGAALPFWGMRKKAVDVYLKAIENGDYSPDEKYLLIAGAKKHCKELENQMAIAEIAHSQAKDGTDFSMNSEVSDEFISRFLEAGKFVSDGDAQLLWGSILAGEFEEPGSTPPSTIRILSELTQQYAIMFSNLCSLSLDLLVDDGTNIILKPGILIIDVYSDLEYLKKLGLTFEIMQELERLGLINLNTMGLVLKYSRKSAPKIHVVYGDQVLSVIDYKENSFPTGHITLTCAGKCIYQYVQHKFVPEHMNAVKAYMISHAVTCTESPEIAITQTIGAPGKHTRIDYKRL